MEVGQPLRKRLSASCSPARLEEELMATGPLPRAPYAPRRGWGHQRGWGLAARGWLLQGMGWGRA